MSSAGNLGDYLIENFDSYALKEEPTVRAGFFVYANFGDPSPYARCFEGYQVAKDADGKEQIEADIFNISWVGVFNERGRGVGTALITRALEEARKRGFRTARMEVENPQVINIFQRIGKTGLIANVRYAMSPMQRNNLVEILPTKQFDSHPNLLSETELAGYFDAFDRAPNGMILESTSYEAECVLDLK